LNPHRYPEAVDPSTTFVTSVFETPDAPDESWFRRTPTSRGQLERKTFRSELLKGERDIWVYTPVGYAPRTGPYPLVILFDGAAYLNATWNGSLPNTLDNLISDRRIRPPVVCLVDTSKSRGSDLGFDETFGDAIATELLPKLRSEYAISRVARDVVIGGFSRLAASLISLRHAGLFGNVLAQSGSFRARMEGSSEPNSLAHMYLAANRIPVRFYLECGLYDNIPNASLPLDEMVLDETNMQGNRHFRDVLLAKGYDVTYRETGGAHEAIHFRATLADGLLALLKP
jgi:enterochelin esterase family protein